MMGKDIVITHECDDCGTEMEHTFHNLDGENKLPICFLSQIDFQCPECGLRHGTGDIDVYNEREW